MTLIAACALEKMAIDDFVRKPRSPQNCESMFAIDKRQKTTMNKVQSVRECHSINKGHRVAEACLSQFYHARKSLVRKL